VPFTKAFTIKEEFMTKRKEYKVKIMVGDATVEIEGEEQGVVSIVAALSKILEGRPQRPVAETGGQVIVGKISPPRIIDIRTFFEEKKPSSDIEAAVVVAFFFEHIAPIDERQDSIDAAILRKAFVQAKWELPSSNLIYTLRNARNAGYLESGPETGAFRLNAVGYNLVEHTLGRERGERLKSKSKKAKRKKRAQKSERK
jgi:hypothetical protein